MFWAKIFICTGSFYHNTAAETSCAVEWSVFTWRVYCEEKYYCQCSRIEISAEIGGPSIHLLNLRLIHCQSAVRLVSAWLSAVVS